MATTHDEHGQRSPGAADTHQDGRSLSSLLKELRDETTMLMREEITLAKTEMSEKMSRLARNGGYMVGGALVAFAGMIMLLMAASAGLYIGLIALGVDATTSLWVAPLVISLVVLAIGYALVQKAMSTLKHESAMPERTAKSVKDDKNWIKEKVTR